MEESPPKGLIKCLLPWTPGIIIRTLKGKSLPTLKGPLSKKKGRPLFEFKFTKNWGT